MKLADFELGVCSWAERFVSDQYLETAITKILETFDGVENLSAEQRDFFFYNFLLIINTTYI